MASIIIAVIVDNVIVMIIGGPWLLGWSVKTESESVFLPLASQGNIST